MIMNFRFKTAVFNALLLTFFVFASGSAYSAGNPALWKYTTKGDFNTVLSQVKTSLEAKQFMISGEDNLSKGLENNKAVLGGDKWNTIGFGNVTAVHFCSLVFNQKVFNMSMDMSILCPFKVVVYNMKKNPDEIHILMVKPTYLLKYEGKKAQAAGKEIESKITSAIEEGAHK